MAVQSIQMSVRAWQPSRKPVPAAAFVDKVAIAPGDPVSKHKGPGHARIDLVSKTLFDFEDEADPAQTLTAHYTETTNEFVRWLAKQDAAVFQALREKGCVTDMSIFIVGMLEEDAIDLDLPVEFLAECARLGLKLTITVSQGE